MRQLIRSQTIPDIPAENKAGWQYIPGGRRTMASLILIVLMLLFSRTTASSIDSQRQLDFYHTHTKDSLSIVYHDGSNYIPAALEQINTFLGDFRNGAVYTIDPATLDILFRLRAHFGGTATFEIISGYRSPETNAMLRAQGRDVAKRSLHMEGKAIDARLRNVNTAKLRDAAIALQLGGVGYYQNSNFVHVDSGRVRTW
jgi:uncharacterized protein YcbK (DUF882 family)